MGKCLVSMLVPTEILCVLLLVHTPPAHDHLRDCMQEAWATLKGAITKKELESLKKNPKLTKTALKDAAVDGGKNGLEGAAEAIFVEIGVIVTKVRSSTHQMACFARSIAIKTRHGPGQQFPESARCYESGHLAVLRYAESVLPRATHSVIGIIALLFILPAPYHQQPQNSCGKKYKDMPG